MKKGELEKERVSAITENSHGCVSGVSTFAYPWMINHCVSNLRKRIFIIVTVDIYDIIDKSTWHFKHQGLGFLLDFVALQLRVTFAVCSLFFG